MNELTKMAFVRAAHSVDPESEQRLSIARIAALTGLTRTDVSQMIRLRDEKPPHRRKPTNRVARVAMGWTTDKRFSQGHSRPRRLVFTGSGNTFSALVRKYSGDIPPKAMLTEMARLGMLRQDQHGELTLVRSAVAQSPRTTKALKAVIPWIRFLAGASTAQIDSELTSRSDSFELKFSSMPQVFAALRELHARHGVFVSGLEQLGSRMNTQDRYSLKVSVAIAATNPRRALSRGQTRKKSKGIGGIR